MHDVFYFTDIHGHLELFHAMREWCYKQDPDCTIIYGGDAADRGEHGYQIIKELLNDWRTVYLYGNHEDLFVKAAYAIIGYCAQNDDMYNKLHNCNKDNAQTFLDSLPALYDVTLHLYNGGMPTLIDWLIDGANEDIIDEISALPRVFTYENVDFCHAGATYSYFLQVDKQEYDAEQQCIWDRDCIPLGWETNRICVHGHTPTTHLPASIYGRDKSIENIHPAVWYDKMGARDKRGGPKIDMDTGMIWSNRGYVLNVLTMNVFGFKYNKQDNIVEEVFDSYEIL